MLEVQHSSSAVTQAEQADYYPRVQNRYCNFTVTLLLRAHPHSRKRGRASRRDAKSRAKSRSEPSHEKAEHSEDSDIATKSLTPMTGVDDKGR